MHLIFAPCNQYRDMMVLAGHPASATHHAARKKASQTLWWVYAYTSILDLSVIGNPSEVIPYLKSPNLFFDSLDFFAAMDLFYRQFRLELLFCDCALLDLIEVLLLLFQSHW